jgi:HEAT repeat protein
MRIVWNQMMGSAPLHSWRWPNRGLRPSMTHSCLACWGTVSSEAVNCPHCNSDLRALDDRAFNGKLIAALRHPEPATRQRAAFVLGERHVAEAAGALSELLDTTAEPFLASEVLTALGNIDHPDVEVLLLRALDHASFVVRQATLHALVERGGATAALAIQRAAHDSSPSVRQLAHDFEPQRENQC